MLLKAGAEDYNQQISDSLVFHTPERLQFNILVSNQRIVRKKTSSAQPFITSVFLHILFILLLFIAAIQPGPVFDDSAGKLGDDMSVVMVELDSMSLSAGSSDSIAAASENQPNELIDDLIQNEDVVLEQPKNDDIVLATRTDY